MTVIVAALVGFLAGRMLWLALRRSWQKQIFLRNNFRGTSLPTAAGIVLPLALLLVEAGRTLVGGFGLGDEPIINAAHAAALVAVTGFALLGLLDDLAGRTDVRGIGGHMRALSKGQLTSGGIKMIAGSSLSLVAAAFVVGDRGAVTIILSAGIIALAANLANLFDLRPGRASKVGLVAFAALGAGSLLDTAIVPVAIVVGATAALILDDLRERLMLGDTGANALGAALGLGLVTQLGDTGLVVGFVALLGLNFASEFVSFTKIIESVGPLRAFDALGRRNQQSTVDVRDAPDDDLPPRPTQGSSRVTVGGAHDATYADGLGQTDSLKRKQERPFSSVDKSSVDESIPEAPDTHR